MTLILGHPVEPVKLGMGVQKQWGWESQEKTFSNSLGMAKDVGSNEFGICTVGESTRLS